MNTDDEVSRVSRMSGGKDKIHVSRRIECEMMRMQRGCIGWQGGKFSKTNGTRYDCKVGGWKVCFTCKFSSLHVYKYVRNKVIGVTVMITLLCNVYNTL